MLFYIDFTIDYKLIYIVECLGTTFSLQRLFPFARQLFVGW